MNEASVSAMRHALSTLIKQSKATFSTDDVLHEFRTAKEKRSHPKLLKMLEAISQNQPKASEHLQEVAKLLEKKDPYFCLLNFLDHYSDEIIVVPTSSMPSLEETRGDTVANVSEIKERILQATTSELNTTTQYAPPAILPVPTLSPSLDSQWDFQVIEDFQFEQSNCEAMPIESQENLLLFDLIYCLTGVVGTYITPDESNQLQISEQIHSSLRDIAKEILPLASYYTCIQKFIQTATFSKCGQVLQALSDALRKLVQDYYLLLSQLEAELNSGHLTLQKMHFYVRPTLNTMGVLAGTVSGIVQNQLRGGQALTLLFDKISALTGDEESQRFIIELTQLSAVPYMDMVQLWVQKGVINDPQEEFLVEDTEVNRREEPSEHNSADYWAKRYIIRQERVPCFLEKVSDIILGTGKYLNVIRQCGKKVTPPQMMHLEFLPTSQNHITVIQNAYSFASKNLLSVLLTENDLMGHLMSVKRYFLLHQGDFITQFMDACEDELAKNIDKVLPMTLENLLGLTLRVSLAKHDTYKDHVHCELLTYDLVTQISRIMNNEKEYSLSHGRLDLTGLECFAFRFEVKWPVSLVLNSLVISKYQMLFRQLFYCKHVERQLCKIWKENSIVKKFSPQATELYRLAFTLRQRMMNAIQNIEYYMMIEVIETNWHIFIQKMNKVENVDEVLSLHQDFLDSCLKDCMLTNMTTLNRSIFNLCNICLKFCEFIQSETSAPTDTFSERVKPFDLEFTEMLITLLKQIKNVAAENPSDRFINLVHRINFNSFYNDQMENLCAKASMMSTT